LKFYFGFSEGRFLRKVLLLTKKERSWCICVSF
jgi:hypothetical protein